MAHKVLAVTGKTINKELYQEKKVDILISSEESYATFIFWKKVGNDFF